MLEKIIAIDKRLLVYLNNLGSPTYDNLWLIITKQSSWIPFFLLLAYLIQKKTGWKNLGIATFFIALILLCCNTTVELCKSTFMRLRPCNSPDIKAIIRILHKTVTFSFFSGHAANSMASMTFLFFILKKHYKYTLLIFLYPLIFAYSRIYLGVHFPSDILTGFLVGFVYGIIFYKLYKITLTKFFINN